MINNGIELPDIGAESCKLLALCFRQMTYTLLLHLPGMFHFDHLKNKVITNF